MKAITCELCGSNDLIKEGDYFVCQHCGTKYSTEDAKKLLVEANVTIANPVSVDGIASIGNLLRRAMRYEVNRDYEMALEYYNKVLDIDIDNIEANEGVIRLRGYATTNVVRQPVRQPPEKVTGPNLIVEYMKGMKGGYCELIVDGRKVKNVWCGHKYEFTLDPGDHEVGMANGMFKCKDPATITIDGYSRYRVEAELKGLKVLWHVDRI